VKVCETYSPFPGPSEVPRAPISNCEIIRRIMKWPPSFSLGRIQMLNNATCMKHGPPWSVSLNTCTNQLIAWVFLVFLLGQLTAWRRARTAGHGTVSSAWGACIMHARDDGQLVRMLSCFSEASYVSWSAAHVELHGDTLELNISLTAPYVCSALMDDEPYNSQWTSTWTPARAAWRDLWHVAESDRRAQLGMLSRPMRGMARSQRRYVCTHREPMQHLNYHIRRQETSRTSFAPGHLPHRVITTPRTPTLQPKTTDPEPPNSARLQAPALPRCPLSAPPSVVSAQRGRTHPPQPPSQDGHPPRHRARRTCAERGALGHTSGMQRFTCRRIVPDQRV